MLIDSLPPLNFKKINVKRLIYQSNSGPCVLLLKNQAFCEPRFESQLELYNFLNDPDIKENGLAIRSGLSPWSEASPVSFNCHSISIGSLMGFTPAYWLEGQASEGTLGFNPLEIILMDHFTPIYEGSKSQWKLFCSLTPEELYEDDVIVFESTLDGVKNYTHSCRVKWVDNKWSALSKLGEHQIVLTPLDHLIKEYDNNFNKIIVYRWAGTREEPCLFNPKTTNIS